VDSATLDYTRSPRAAAEALGLIGRPAAVLGRRGQLLAANRLFEDLMPAVARERGERLAFTDSAADALFAEALAPVIPSDAADAVCSIPIRARAERPPMIAHLVPLDAAARDVLAGASGILILTPLTLRAPPTAEVLQVLFDLTPAEARVARGIGEGRTVDAIAETFGLSRETVRSQLKAVLGKTGLGRQADLVAMLAGVHVSGG
jgi:DNA-binding CsgD family transcriptional regulator